MSKQSTRYVFLNLFKESGMWETVGETFSTDSEEVFTNAAKRWLGDKSNLSSKTIESANWTEIYEYFKNRQD